MTTYALVISDDPDEHLKKFGDRMRGYKKADWLYDGVIYNEPLTKLDLKQAILPSKEFLPTVVIDGNQWIQSDQFSPDSWKQNLEKFLDFSEPGKIMFYVLE